MRGSVGERFSIAIFGESHGRCVGCLIGGCPSGLGLDVADVQSRVDLRRPFSRAIHTRRREPDKVELLSGIYNGRTTGAPLLFLVRNRDVSSSGYETYRRTPRPGHADYLAQLKFGGFQDWRGGGMFSGRMTLPMVMGGAVAEKLLKTTLGVETMAYAMEIGGVKMRPCDEGQIRQLRYSTPVRCPDPNAARAMERIISRVAKEGDSVGGIVEVISTNVPPGLGEPPFSELDSDLAKALFAIPAVKGVEFGAGFQTCRLRGSESNDGLRLSRGRITFRTNRSGGIIGGMSNGMPIVIRIAFKPTPSIRRVQRTVDIARRREVNISIRGRHDPCVVPRAVPVVEAMVSITLADHALRAGKIKSVIKMD